MACINLVRMNELKQELYSLCKAHLEKGINEVALAITDRRSAMHNETKSSMGDKYETTREMLQQEINMNMDRLSKMKAELAALEAIDINNTSPIIIPGCVVTTDSGSFFLSVSVGKLIVNGKQYYAVSSSSPIGLQLKGKQQGEAFSLNGKAYNILSIF